MLVLRQKLHIYKHITNKIFPVTGPFGNPLPPLPPPLSGDARTAPGKQPYMNTRVSRSHLDCWIARAASEAVCTVRYSCLLRHVFPGLAGIARSRPMRNPTPVADANKENIQCRIVAAASHCNHSDRVAGRKSADMYTSHVR